MKKALVYDCSFIELPKIEVVARKGNLTVAYNNESIPFEVKRVFYTYDIPGGEARGAHAHKECHQFLVAASGSFEVALDDGKNKRTVMDCIFLLAYGRQSKGSLLEQFVWFWHLRVIWQKIILEIMMSS